ncbi:FtsX-like permease family protein [Gemella cuniculi]|uniref:FtsX-like permease family protein n=1 Tax=Gemella cuniculi TaxID=150240 RepID=UPI0004275B11|nr:FtsX-like permease family protein [Gemella cuniculi]
MPVFKRAYLYIIRKKVKSVIMFLLLTIISTLLLSSNILNNTTKSISNKIYENSSFGFTVENTSKTNKEIPMTKLDEISKLPEVKNSNYKFSTPVKVLNKKVVEGKGNVVLNEDVKKPNLVMLNANTTTSQNSDFKSEVLKLEKGRHIEATDKYKVLVHEEFAKLNGLDIGSKIELEKNEGENKNTTSKKEYEVVGIYSGKKSNDFQGLSSDLIENTVYTDYNSSQELMKFSKNDFKVTSVDYFVKDPKKLEETIQSVKKLSIDEIEVSKSNKNFQTVIASLQSIEKIINLVRIGSIISSVIILSLVLIFWLRERLYEIGVLLSIGNSKIKIVTQQILELIFISIFSITISSIIESVILKYGIKSVVEKLGTEDLPEAISQQILNVKVGIGDITLVSIILFLIIVFAVGATSMIILRMKPKDILSKMS